MDDDNLREMSELVAGHRVMGLGTVDREGWPRVSMVLFAVEVRSGSLLIHVSRLALHTKDLLEDQRVGLLVMEKESETRNPQTLARLSIQAEAEPIDGDEPAYSEARATYLARHPNTSLNFQLGDFMLFRLRARNARFVAGFGKIFDVTAEELRAVFAGS